MGIHSSKNRIRNRYLKQIWLKVKIERHPVRIEPTTDLICERTLLTFIFVNISTFFMRMILKCLFNVRPLLHHFNHIRNVWGTHHCDKTNHDTYRSTEGFTRSDDVTSEAFLFLDLCAPMTHTTASFRVPNVKLEISVSRREIMDVRKGKGNAEAHGKVRK